MKKRFLSIVLVLSLLSSIVALSSISVCAEDEVYSLAGTFNGWDKTDASTELTYNLESGLFELEIRLKEGTYEFKVLKDHDWTESYGTADGGNITVSVSADGPVTICFDPNSKAINCYGKYVYEITEHVYRVAGDANLCGTNWEPKDDNNMMTLDSSTGFYTKKYVYVANAGDTLEFKIVMDGATWLGVDDNENVVITFSESGVYGITITFNESTKEINYSTEVKSDLVYTTNEAEHSATITQYVGESTDLVIPSQLDGYDVTGIAAYAFKDCKSLVSIEIPSSVTSIGALAFYGCTALNNISVDNGNTEYASYDGALYNKSLTKLISCPSGKETIEFADSVTDIMFGAFWDCTALTGVVLPKSLSVIEANAFAGCTGLKTVVIPDGLTSIGSYAFICCESLKDVNIPASVTNIDFYAFGGCTALESVTLQNGLLTIGDFAFCECTSLKNVNIPASVTNIGSGAFGACSMLENINVDKNNAQYASFDGVLYNNAMTDLLYCPNGKKSVKVADSLSNIELGAFSGCSNLISVVIPDGASSISSLAFYGCTNLTAIKIPPSVSSIKADSFADCDALTIYGYTGSYAETYANTNSIPFEDASKMPEIELDSDDITDTDTESDTDTETDSDTDPEPDLDIIPKTKGDVDGDGKLTLKDASYIQRSLVRFLALNDYQKEAADVDGDGKVTLKDASKIQRTLVGLDNIG